VSGKSGSGSVCQDSVGHWINESTIKWLNISNTDETALFYSLMPDNSLNMRGEACTGGKKSQKD
jgi:hypothetical protein